MLLSAPSVPDAVIDGVRSDGAAGETVTKAEVERRIATAKAEARAVAEKEAAGATAALKAELDQKATLLRATASNERLVMNERDAAIKQAAARRLHAVPAVVTADTH